MKILVIGATGFIGSYLLKELNAQGTSFSGKSGYIQFDIRNGEKYDDIIKEVAPDLVINSSGISNVDDCERREKEALEVNGTAVASLARSSYKSGAYFVQLSTDYVFDGKRGSYSESDEPNPINSYGKSKLLGEKNALKYNGLVLRISTPYGINYAQNKDSFISFIVKKLKSKEAIKIADDQITTPTYIKDVKTAIIALHKSNITGVIHLGSKQVVSRYDFALKTSKKFGLNSDYITRIKLNELKFIAKRPVDSSLKSEKIQAYIKLESIDSNLEDLYKDYLNYGIL